MNVNQIQEFILKIRKEEPMLGCRKIAALVNKRFQVQVSKSHINALIKQAGLSSRVGRRRKHKKGFSLESDGLGAFLLRAIDFLVDGVTHITEAIKQQLGKETPDLQGLTETLIYSPETNPILWSE